MEKWILLNQVLAEIININEKRSVIVPDDYHDTRFENKNFTFLNLKNKYRDDYNVAMQNLKEQYSFSKIDYKTFHPNLLRNHDHIEFHQQIHRDFTIDPPIVVTKKKILNKL